MKIISKMNYETLLREKKGSNCTCKMKWEIHKITDF